MSWNVGPLVVSQAIVALAGQVAQPAQPAPVAPDAAARAVVQRGIDYAGGFAAWASRKSVEFRKTVTRFRPDGSVERRRVETHRYRLQPSFGGRIERDEEGKNALMVNNGTRAWRFVDGQELTTQEESNSARGSTFGSHYVFGMPFKLLDPGVQLASAGRERLADGTEVEKVRATYDRGAGDAGGYHTWTYYFDTKTGRLCANHLNYEADQYDFSEYFDDQSFSGVRVATRRRGYSADASGKTGPLVSETLYEQVRFDVPLPDSLFSPPNR